MISPVAFRPLLKSIFSALWVGLFLVSCLYIPFFRAFVSSFEPLIPFLVIISGIILYWNQSLEQGPFCLWFEDRVVSIFGCGFIISLFLAALFANWMHSPTGMIVTKNSVGGVIPYDDALGYYFGANKLLLSGSVDGWNSRRPLNALLLALRLWVCQRNFFDAMVFQAILNGLGVFFAATTARTFLRPGASVIFLGVLYSYGRQYVSLTLTESLGFTYSCMAFSLVFYGLRTGSAGWRAMGYGLLALALNIRAGAFFILPLALLGEIFLPRGNRHPVSILLICLLCAGLGFLPQKVALKWYGAPDMPGHGNFAHALYGLADKGSGWQAVFTAFPELTTMSEASQTAYLYEKALDRIRTSPHHLFIGLLKGMAYAIPVLGWQMGRLALGIRGNPDSKILCLGVSALFWLYFLRRYFQKTGGNTDSKYTLFLFLGIILSLPVIYPDGGFRILASVFPFFAFFFARLLVPEPLTPNDPDLTPAVSPWPGIILSVGMIVAGLILPVFLSREPARQKVSEVQSPVLTPVEAHVITETDGRIPFFNIIDKQPEVNPELFTFPRESFFRPFSFMNENDNREAFASILPLQERVPPYSVGMICDEINTFLVIGPVDFFQSRQGRLSLHLKRIPNSLYYEIATFSASGQH